MFRYIVESPAPVDRRKAYVLPLSIVTHLVVVAAAVALPLLAPSVLPVPATTLMAFINHDVVTPPAPPAAPAPRTATESRPIVEDVNPFAAPVVQPDAIGPEPVGETTRGLVRGVEASDGVLPSGLSGAVVDTPAAPPPAEPEKPRYVGGVITRPTKIHDVMPEYPSTARLSRVSGLVIIEATIGPAGDVLDAKVLRGHPLLDSAALGAVRQWRFTPTRLNGKAIAVVMTVTVDFKLQ